MNQPTPDLRSGDPSMVLDNVPGPRSKLSSGRRLAWFALVAFALLLVAFLKVRAYDYDRSGLNPQSITIVRLWWVQIQGLPDVAYDGLLAFLFATLTLIFLAGCAGLLWYSLYPIEPGGEGPSETESSSGS